MHTINRDLLEALEDMMYWFGQEAWQPAAESWDAGKPQAAIEAARAAIAKARREA